MRTRKSAINAGLGVLSYLIIMAVNLITRRALVTILGLEIVGLDSLLKSIISMLSLAELGLSTGLLYKLYKPLAEKNYNRISSILLFYKKAYFVIFLIILLSGIGLSFYIDLFVKEDYSKIQLRLLFLLYLADTLTTYIFAHRKALIVADQKNFIINITHSVFQIIMCTGQLVLLSLYKSFIVFLVVRVIINLCESLFIGHSFNRLYPMVNITKNTEPLPSEERESLFRNIKAMFFHRIGTFSGNSSASIIINTFISSFVNGMYANYTLITQTLLAMISQIYDGVSASFGNLMNSEDKETVYSTYNILFFMNYLIASFCTISFSMLVQPVILFLFGEISLMNVSTVVLMSVLFYFTTMRKTVLMAKDNAGLYHPDRYFTLLETIINILLSILMVSALGVNGVVAGNIISFLLIPMWTQPKIVYNDVLQKPVREYHVRYTQYFVVFLISWILTALLVKVITVDNLFAIIIIRSIICLIVPNTINYVAFKGTKEFIILKNKAQDIVKTYK